jgi:hypothetical protein
MGVQFTAAVRPTHWMTSCAFDDTTYPTYEAAQTAARAHPEGGCDAGKAFFASLEGLGGREALDAENAVDARFPGRWATQCVYERCQVPHPVYAEEPPIVGMAQSGAEAVLRSLGFCAVDDNPNAAVDRVSRTPETLGEAIVAMCPPDVEWCGRVSPTELADRIAVALALPELLAEPVSYTAATLRGGARFLTGGAAPDYVVERLGSLRRLAQWAEEHDAEVVWS